MNTCPQCQKSWCHMCNLEQKIGRDLFNSVEKGCWGVFELCWLFYFMRFTEGADGRRQRRSDGAFYCVSIVLFVFFIPVYTIILVIHVFIWTFRTTVFVISKCWYICPLFPLIVSFYLAYFLLCVLYVIVTFTITVITKPWSICIKYRAMKNTPLFRSTGDERLISGLVNEI